MTMKRFHALIALLLLVCVICPFAEMLVHSDSCIFVTGDDCESTLAFLILVAELAFALAKVLVLLPTFIERIVLLCSFKPRFVARKLGAVPLLFPPVPLRI